MVTAIMFYHLIVKSYIHEYLLKFPLLQISLWVYDCLIKDMYDPIMGKTYGALSCCNDKVYADRCKVQNAPKVMLFRS